MKKKNIKIILPVLLIYMLLGNHCNCNAYTLSDGTIKFNFNIFTSNDNSNHVSDITFTPQSNNDRCVVFYNEEMSQKMTEVYGNFPDKQLSDWFFVFANNRLSYSYNGYVNENVSNIINSAWFSQKLGADARSHNINGRGVAMRGTLGEGNSAYSVLSTFDNVQYNNIKTENVQYVTTWEELKKYLVDGDNSVIKEGNPLNPPITQDNTLPVPQSLTCDLHNSYNASNPFIEGSWKNPNNASWDAIKNDVKIHIQYKPKFQFYKRFISVKDGQRAAHQYIELGTEHNENKNHWVNAFPNTPTLKDNYIKYETLQQDMQDVARMVAAGEEFYPGGATLLNGTSWRVRYELPDGRVSFWAVYGVNSIGDIKSSDTVSFQDNEDNAVSADAVEYQNSWQTDPNNYNPDTINNSLLSRLRQALNDIQSLPSDMNTVANEGSSFANFLQKVWQKFPEIYIIFIGGLIIAIILRILGR